MADKEIKRHLAKPLEIDEIQLSKAVAILFGVTVKMAHPDTKLPPSANKGQSQYNTGVDIASIRELVLDDLDNGFLETLDNLLPGTSSLDTKTARTLFAEIRSNPLHKIFVAVIPQRQGTREVVVGTTTLLIEPKFIFNGGRVGHIEDVSIRRGYENMGLGRRLVLHTTGVAKEMGCVKIVLDCSDETMPFYEKFGYSYQDNCMKKFLQTLAHINE
jgi:glucosamine-phosphate N-acetyltransferase